MNIFSKYLLGACAVGIFGVCAMSILHNTQSPVSAAVESVSISPANAEGMQVAQAKQSTTSTPATALPGGATSVQETHQDWQVACGQQADVKHCSMSQQQQNAKSRQRVLAIELQSVNGKLEGALVLPFGLSLDRGVALQIDDATVRGPLQFRTCVPAGCIVPLSFDAPSIEALANGTLLKIKTVGDGGKELALSVSLKGFSAARDRMVALAH